MSLQTLVDLLVGGVTLGGIYALIAFTLSMALATTHVMNVAHGTIMVLGAAAATFLLTHVQMGIPLALLLLALGACVAGVLFETALVRPILHRPPDTILVTSIVITFGLAIAVQTLLGFYWVKLVDPEPTFTITLSLPALQIGDLALPTRRLVILAFAVLAILAFHLALQMTRIGKAARALAQNYEGALIVGVRPRAVSLFVFTAGTAFTALAGAFYAWAIPVNPFDGIWLTLVALIVVVLGGVGSLVGALAGGILLGLAQTLTAFLLSPAWSVPVLLAILLVVLVVRPEGLLGGRG